MNVDDLDWDRPDLICEPQQARGIPRNLQLDETVVVVCWCGGGALRIHQLGRGERQRSFHRLSIRKEPWGRVRPARSIVYMCRTRLC